MHPLLRVWFALLVLCVGSLAAAQPSFGGPPKQIKWTAAFESGQLALRAEIEPGWHLYSSVPVKDGPFPTTVRAEGITLGAPIDERTPIKKFDPNFEKEVQLFDERAELRVPITAKSAPTATVALTYQLCNDSSCLTPYTQKFELPTAELEPVSATSDTGTAADAPPGTTSAAAPASKRDYGGLLAFLGTSLIAGFLALITPCVFPMIPITVSIFSKRGGGNPVPQAVAFCLGIISTFTVLGVGVSVIFGATGLQNFANNPWLNLAMGVLFIVLALSLFGVYELVLPSSWANKLNQRTTTDGKSRTAWIAPVLMGLVFSITSFTCTMPFVGTLLVSAAQGDLLYPIAGMIGFSTAFALPFFALALFPQALSKMPKSGSWLNTVKATMGFVELAAAVKFLSSVDLAWRLGWLTKPVFLGLWITIMIVAGMFLMRWIAIPTVEESGRPGIPRILAAVGSFALAIWFMAGMNGASLKDLESFLPPDPYPYRKGATAVGSTKPTDEAGWLTNYEAGLAEAKRQGKPLFVDFTGIFCSNCRYMEKNVFPVASVQAEFKNFVLAKLYTDQIDNPDDIRYQKLKIDLTGNAANPVYAVLTPDGKLLGSAEYERDPARFTEFLRKSRLAFQQ
ncbi:MAG: cytochrome c biogenesis protein CcdA [Fimbriimonadaceae bacterium]|nr:cytochrome c biogenesis protein CcdA [Fimbriimonadaceae bacterium]